MRQPPRQPIARLLANIPDHNMRMRRAAEFLAIGSPALVVIAIEKAALESRDPVQRVFYGTLVHLLFTIRPRPPLPAGPLPLAQRELLPDDERIDELIGVARQLHARFTAVLLAAMWAPPHRYDDKLLPLHVTIDHLTLGHRRERARLARRSAFEPLLLDTTPSVVQLLAFNPRLRQDDAVRMAAMRPQHPWALWAILLNHRWLTSQMVREAVALNPYARTWTTFALAPLIGSERLGRVVQKISLPADLLTAMLPLYGGACGPLIAEVLGRGPPTSGTLIFEIDETEADVFAALAEIADEPAEGAEAAKDISPD